MSRDAPHRAAATAAAAPTALPAAAASGAPAVEGAQAVDAQHPWPGLAAYDELASDFFKGREAEAQALARLVQASNLVVLYGRSGLGKSSLLLAGVFPLLREARLLPVYLRIDHGAGAPDVLEQIARRLAEEAAQRGLQITPRGEGESLWRWLHRSDFDLATHDNWPLQPVFVLDQFEEVFAHAERGGRMQATLAALADLAGNRISDEVAGSREATRGLDLARHNYRMLFSFREDYLPEIRVWERSLPALLRHYLRLEPMSAARAEAAVQAAGKAVLEDGAAGAIVRFVGNLGAAGRGGRDDIEPVLLSLTCTRLNLRRGAPQRISPKLVDEAGPNILQDFYAEALAGMPERVHRFIEGNLIQGERARGSYSRAEALEGGLLTEAELELLTRQRRLLRIESQSGEPRIELIHDRLVDVVRLARDRHTAVQAAQAATEAERREATEQLAAQAVELKRSRKWLIGALAGAAVLLVALLLAVHQAWQNSDAAQANARAAQAAASAAVAAGQAAKEQEQRATEAQRRAEEATRQLKQQLDFFAFNVTGNLTAEQLMAKSAEADRALRAMLASQGEADRQRRSRTRLEIWTKDIDGPRVLSAIAELGFDTVVREANVKDVSTNALWMGCGAELEDLKLVALALLRAGVTLRWMGAVPAGNPNRGTALVQVGAGVPFAGLPALSVEQVQRAANPCKPAR